jgi:hypothetical protein
VDRTDLALDRDQRRGLVSAVINLLGQQLKLQTLKKGSAPWSWIVIPTKSHEKSFWFSTFSLLMMLAMNSLWILKK